MTFYRHFIQRPEFEVMVFSPAGESVETECDLGYELKSFDRPNLWRRLCHTRFSKWIHAFEMLYGGVFLPRKVIKEAKLFKPDAVFTVAGSWDWTALAAQKLAYELRVPLIASFNDWYDYGSFLAHERFRKSIELRFRLFYQQADLALCTCEGMQASLGEHRNVHIWYPTGAPVPSESDPYTPTIANADRPLTVFFGGSLGDWYGPMLEALVTYCREFEPSVCFKIFGALETWSDEFDQWARDAGVFGGRVSFEDLGLRAAEADLLILPMGFGEECAQVERTSFKTKFLDYLSFQRPILVWGPEYCSAVKVAREFDSAECVLEEDVVECASTIARLASDPKRRQKLIGNARRMYEGRFHPDLIHQKLVDRVSALVEDY